MSEIVFHVCESDEGKRIDSYLSSVLSDFTRSAIQLLCQENAVVCNCKAANKSYKVHAGDSITVIIPEPKAVDILPQNIPLDIVYEDNDLLVVNKPKGMVVHPAPGNFDGTLVNALMYHCGTSLSGIGGEIRPGIVHRIDKDTSGLLVVAKNDRTHQGLSEQISTHDFHRVYQAVCYGRIKEDGFVEAPIGRDRIDRKKMCVTPNNSKYAYTSYHILNLYQNFSHIECKLKTGRTHQIRVHMAHIGHPLAGDPVYGPKKIITKLNGQCLHAKELGFVHPISGKKMLFVTELPEYFCSFLRSLNMLD